jgi:hypothetical protein
MLKELGLGALLFIAGDSELGRRAGDALIADKIGDALEEGGFDAVSLGPWAVGKDDTGFYVDFSEVSVRRGAIGVTAERARYHPFSSAVAFEAGTLRHDGGEDIPPLAWSFTAIDLEVAGWRSIRVLSADARGLRSLGPVATLMAYPLPGTLQAPEALDHLRFLYDDRGRSLEVSWAASPACAMLSLSPAQAVPLLELRPFLASEGAAAEVRSSVEGCDHLISTGRAAFSALDVSPALLEIFLEELPEAYTYLLR